MAAPCCQPKYRDNPEVPRSILKSTVRNVSKGVKLFDLLVKLKRTEKTSEGDMIIYVYADPTSFKLPPIKGSLKIANLQDQIVPIRIPRYLPLFDNVKETCSRSIGKIIYVTSVSFLESSVIIFNERSRICLWNIRNAGNSQFEQLENSTRSLHMNREGLTSKTQSPIQVPRVALLVSSQPSLSASTLELLMGLQDMPSGNESPPIEVPAIALPADLLSRNQSFSVVVLANI